MTTTTSSVIRQLAPIRSRIRKAGVRPTATKVGTYPMEVHRFLDERHEVTFAQVHRLARAVGLKIQIIAA